jgi:hypothetical protein
MELQRRETTGCLRADANGEAADTPARRAGSLFQNEDGHSPAGSSASVVRPNKHTRRRN